MHIQLWSYNYDPEPTGIAPLSTVVARALAERGHRVEVVAAHPHYPNPQWGNRLFPYHEDRDGIPVLRLPLWPGRSTAFARVRQELTFTTALSFAAPLLSSPDVVLAVSPSFPALLPGMLNSRGRRVPWVLWLQDILPDGASATGILAEGMLVRAARRFEHAAYGSASRIVVISEACAENLRAKGVPDQKVVHIYNPASRPIREMMRPEDQIDERLVLTMGNIGHTQNLANVTRAFERSADLEALGARFVMAGDGVAAEQVRATIRTDRVEVTGILDFAELEHQLTRAAVAVVSQHYEGQDFNLPSKLMNFMGYGIPVVGFVRPQSEVATLLRESGGGWVSDNRNQDEFARLVAGALRDPEELSRRGERSLTFARRHFSPDSVAQRFEAALEEVIGDRSQPLVRPTETIGVAG